MKRLSLATTLVAVAFVAALAIATTSASASVLCKSPSFTYYCGYENTYAPGTQFIAALAPGTKATLKTAAGGSISSCSASNLRFGYPKVGGEQNTNVGFSEFSFGSCDSSTQTLITKSPGTGSIGWISGTHNGEMWMGLLVENPKTQFGGNCSYVIEGPGEIVGGTTPKLVFNKATAVFDSGLTYVCPKAGVTFSATYNFTSPTPLYVEKN